ncbi:hypothetical protein ABPG72_017507 [Tetrahymena utriculariae]
MRSISRGNIKRVEEQRKICGQWVLLRGTIDSIANHQNIKNNQQYNNQALTQQQNNCGDKQQEYMLYLGHPVHTQSIKMRLMHLQLRPKLLKGQKKYFVSDVFESLFYHSFRKQIEINLLNYQQTMQTIFKIIQIRIMRIIQQMFYFGEKEIFEYLQEKNGNSIKEGENIISLLDSDQQNDSSNDMIDEVKDLNSEEYNNSYLFANKFQLMVTPECQKCLQQMSEEIIREYYEQKGWRCNSKNQNNFMQVLFNQLKLIRFGLVSISLLFQRKQHYQISEEERTNQHFDSSEEDNGHSDEKKEKKLDSKILKSFNYIKQKQQTKQIKY